ncbi:MAG: 3-oxoadipyl-CoA thiolase [Gammaproteobacteria bacterium]|nr:3-oxoadipyl-CoA thiolase [Gammaproteobacteria bacterium]
MIDAYIFDAIRTPVGRFGGKLASVRTDDLGSIPLKALQERNPGVEWGELDDVIYGCANQAGEDNRNVARMSALLAGLPVEVPGTTVNRLCASGMDAIAMASRAIKAGEARLIAAGGVESMSRAPFVMPKATSAFSRNAELYDTTIGWRFVNPRMKSQYGIDSMPETAENVAEQFGISREDQDTFAWRSQQRAGRSMNEGLIAQEIVPVSIPQRRGEMLLVDKDEHPRPDTTREKLASLSTPFRENGTVTAGNSSGVNDGSCALLLGAESAGKRFGLTPLARVVGAAAAGTDPRLMGIGPVPATRKLLGMTSLTIEQMDVIEINEAFAAQSLAVLRELGLPDDASWVNPNGGAIALGHPLGMSGARLVTTAVYQLQRTGGRYGLCSLCVGVGQGVSIIVERL